MRIHSQSFVVPQEFQKAMKSKQNSPILLYCNNVRKRIIEFYASFSYIGVIPPLQQILYFVSASNHNDPHRHWIIRPVVSYFVSTSNHNKAYDVIGYKIVVSYFVSTSNHNMFCFLILTLPVVSYFVSTSNHNSLAFCWNILFVVSYFVSTSNHNNDLNGCAQRALYLILFLHQTTTTLRWECAWCWLYLILFLHQTTTQQWQHLRSR